MSVVKSVIMVSFDKKIGSIVFCLFVCPCLFFVCFFVIVVVFLLMEPKPIVELHTF